MKGHTALIGEQRIAIGSTAASSISGIDCRASRNKAMGGCVTAIVAQFGANDVREPTCRRVVESEIVCKRLEPFAIRGGRIASNEIASAASNGIFPR